jgi:hypothetical protein
MNTSSKNTEAEQCTIPSVSSSFSIIVWNKKQDRPATNDEIDFLINGDDNNGQLFLAWNKVIVTKEEKGQIYLHIDSGEENNYEIRYVV